MSKTNGASSIPVSPDDLAFESLGRIGALLRAGAISCREIVDVYLARIERLDACLNAFVHVAGEQARAEAERLDREFAAGRDRGPLHGIPIAVKDIIDVSGMPTSYGTGGFDPTPVARDATLVGALREAGAVVLGKSNTHEFAYAAFHPDFGYARNPWDPSRTAGATSGGSAAAVAGGLCAAALGTDAGGSVRLPAAFCGVVGMKVSYDSVDLSGAFPSCWTLDHAGAIGRSAGCVAAMVGAMSDRETSVPSPVALAGRRFGVVRDLAEHACVSPGVASAFAAALDAIAAGGAGIVPMELPEVLGANDAMMDILLPEILVIHEPRLRRHRADYAPATLAEIERGAEVPATAYVRARRFRESLAARLHLAMDEARLDGLLCPTAPWPAPADLPAANDEAMLLEGVCATPFSVSGIPAITLPCGLAEDGLPAGLQLAGRAGGDRDVLVAAACIEASLGRRIPERPPDCA